MVGVHEKMRDDGQAFDVVETGRPREETADLDEWRLHAGASGLSFDGADERRAFAADVCAAAGIEVELEVEALAEDVFPEESVIFGLPDGIQQERAEAGVFGAHINVAVGSAHDIAGDNQRLDQVERVVFDELAVFEGRGLSLVGIADDDFVFADDSAGL